MSESLAEAEYEENEDDFVPDDQEEKASGQQEDSAPERREKSDSPLVNFGGFEINTQKRMEEYDNGEIRAYKVTPKRGNGSYFAYACEPHIVPRHIKTEVYQSIINPNMLKLEKHGAVYWPSAKQERYVFIYEDTLGKKVLKSGDVQAMGLKNDIVLDRILKPFMGILQDFRDRDFIHGSIRATNLYTGGSAKLDKIVLGDCLTTPSSYNQDSVYEPIERAMADPIARGPGVRGDDLYSLGVLMTVLLRTSDPMEGLSEQEIIKKKMELGSYVALTGKDRFTGSLLELLRGLLHDDPVQRWNVEEMLAWMDGRRLSPKQSGRRQVAQRPITFNQKKYLQPRVLAMDIHRNPPELKRILEEGELKNWINRALERPDIYERVEDAIDNAKNGGGGSNGYEEKLVTHVSLALDSGAPIRYYGHSMFPEGVGSFLAEAFVQKKDLNFFMDIFLQNIVLSWIRMQTNPSIDIGALVSKFDSCRNFVRQKNTGFGLERCLYILNPEVHCLSDKLKNYYVLSPEDMMYAFEDMALHGNKAGSLFIDRHIAAFLSVKDGKVIDSLLPDINATEHYKKVMANLTVLANLQRRSQLPFFPGISKAIASQLGVVYKRYHDRTIRERLKKNIDKFAEDGDLIKMAAVLENPELQQKDFQAFREAMIEYNDLKNEAQRLETRLMDKDTFGIATGQEAAAVISSIVSGVVVLVMAFLYFSDSGVF